MNETRIDSFHGVAELRQLLAGAGVTAQAGGWGTVLVDHAGTIRRCSDPARWMFLAGQGELEGSTINLRVSGLVAGNDAAGDEVRSIVALSDDGDWHRFEAVDVFGRRFPVELAIFRHHSGAAAQFLLYLRYGLAADG